MKVALELQPLLKHRTGVGWYTFEIIKRLVEQESGIEYSGFYFNFLNRNQLPEELSNVTSKVCKLMHYRVYQRIWNYVPISYSSIFGRKADIYHFFNYLVPPGVKGKVIVTIYDMVFKRFPGTMSNANFKALENNLLKSADRADIIITISENSKNEIVQYLGIDPAKIQIVSPGVDVARYKEDISVSQKEAVKRKYNLPDEYILYLGTLEPRKNVESIIDSFFCLRESYNKDIKLVIAGKKGWGFDTIFQRVESYGLQECVDFIGYVEEVDKPAIYNMAEVFMFPSLYEGFGMPVIEAMAAGVPVITSNNSSLPEAAGDAAKLLDPMDTEAMAAELYNILTNSSMRDEMIKKGLEQSSRFTWENSIEQLVNIYKRI